MPSLLQLLGIDRLAAKILLALVLLLVVLSGGLAVHAKTLRLERDLSRAQVEDLARVVDGVNQKVAEWKKSAELQAQAASSARREAEQIRAQGERRVAELQAAKIPADCSEAVQWGAAEILRTLGGEK